jgi:AcrR family transcriptional regulator
MATDTKDRILGAGAELFRRQGYNGTGVKQIVSEAQAPFASLYHFFPGGKAELGEEVIRSSGAQYGKLAEVIIDPAPDLVAGVRAFFEGAAVTLAETDYADACPIATVALEVASTNEVLRRATADVFEGWISGLAARFEAGGISRGRARELATSFIAALEGAFVLSRAMRDTAPVMQAGELIAAAVAAEIN